MHCASHNANGISNGKKMEYRLLLDANLAIEMTVAIFENDITIFRFTLQTIGRLVLALLISGYMLYL